MYNNSTRYIHSCKKYADQVCSLTFIPTGSTSPRTVCPLNLSDRPELPLFTCLHTRSGDVINIIQRIGAKYQVLGIQLLDDKTGSITEAIIASRPISPAIIVLSMWLQGSGRQPVTWATFITVLKEVGLIELGKDIEEQGKLLYMGYGHPLTMTWYDILIYHSHCIFCVVLLSYLSECCLTHQRIWPSFLTLTARIYSISIFFSDFTKV